MKNEFYIKRIVTHNGQTHSDDFLATAILAHKFNVTIHRVSSVSKEELEDNSIIVVDVGGKYEPEKNNFDHHQDLNIPCSLILVLNKFFPNIKVNDIDELRFIDDWDRIGPHATQIKWNIKLPEFRDIISDIILDIFSKKEVIYPETRLHDTIKEIGKIFLEKLVIQNDFITNAKNAEIFKIKDLKIVKLNKNIPIRFIKKIHPDVAIVVKPNQRVKDALTLTRVDDNPRVDFKRIKDNNSVYFVHPNGFMAVVSPDIFIDAIKDSIE